MNSLKYFILISIIAPLAITFQSASALELEEKSRLSVNETSPAIPTRNALMSPAPTLIKIYDPQQRAVFSERIRQNQRLVYSNRGEHFAILKYNDHSPTTFSLLEIKVCNLDGKVEWTLKKPNGSSVILADGVPAAAVLDGAEGLSLSHIRLHGVDGSENAVIPVTHLFGIDFSGDGRVLFINSADSGLTAYDSDGQELYDYGPCRRFGVSGSGSIVVTESNQTLSLFSNGVRIKSDRYDFDNYGALKEIVVSDSLGRVFVLYRRAVVAYTLPTFEREWTFHEIPDGSTLTSIDVSDDGFIAYGFDIPEMKEGYKVHEKGGFGILNISGVSLAAKEMTYSSWARSFPMVRFTLSGDGLQVAARSEVCYYSIIR